MIRVERFTESCISGGRGRSLALALCACAALVASSACAQDSPPTYTPEPPPEYTHVSVSLAHEDPAWLVAVEGVWTVAEAVITEHVDSYTGEVPRPVLSDGEERTQYRRYSVWTVEVLRYLVDHVEHDVITLHKRDGFVLDDGTLLPSRFPVSLQEGEHALLFLSKESLDPLDDDEYTLWEGSPFVSGKISIVDGMVAWQGETEPVGDFVARLKQYADDAGRSVPS